MNIPGPDTVWPLMRDERRAPSRISRIVLAALAAVAIGLTGCDSGDPGGGLVVEGGGEGLSAEFALPAGFYVVRWAADGGQTGRRCLFGLTLETVEPAFRVEHGDRVADGPLRLAYETASAGARIDGASAGFRLGPGVYRLRSEGGCGWRVRILPSQPGPELTTGPRM